MKKSTCTICGRQFQMGKNGICDPDRCDDCAGVVRDSTGYAWEPGEQEHEYLDVRTWEVTTVRRVDALR